MQGQRAWTHLAGIPNLSIVTYLAAVKVVRSVVKCQLVLLAVQNELTFADAVSPTTYQSRQVWLIAAGKLLDVVMTLDNVSYFAILTWNHNSTNGTSIV